MADDRDWIEIFKIQQLIYRYFDSVNRGDFVMMRTLFADHAVWENLSSASVRNLPTGSWSSSETRQRRLNCSSSRRIAQQSEIVQRECGAGYDDPS